MHPYDIEPCISPSSPDFPYLVSDGICNEVDPLVDWKYGGAYQTAVTYLQIGDKEKALAITCNTTENLLQQMRWYLSMNDKNLRSSKSVFESNSQVIQEAMLPIIRECGDEAAFTNYFNEWGMMRQDFDFRIKK